MKRNVMKLTQWIAASGTLAATTLAHAVAAYQVRVPEVGAAGSMAAITVVGVVAAAVWERRRKK